MERGGGWAGSGESRRELFEPASIQRLTGHFAALLAAAAADPARPALELPLLGAAESFQLLRGWNDTAPRPFPVPRLHQLFERQARRRPAALAVVGGRERCSYGELNERATRLAHQLRALGVRPEEPVGVLLERSAAMVAALLGILKAGGAYLPIEPRTPAARTRWILDAMGVRVLVVDGVRLPAAVELLAELPGLDHLVCVDLAAAAARPALAAGRHLWTPLVLASQPADDLDAPGAGSLEDPGAPAARAARGRPDT